MDKRHIRNCLGGTYTAIEFEKARSFTRYHDENAKDTNRAIILKSYGLNSYQIRLLSSDRIIDFVGCSNPPSTSYQVGKEVTIKYTHGNRYLIQIDGGQYVPIPYDMFGSPSGRSGSSSAMAMMQTALMQPIVLSDETDLPPLASSRLHKDLTGDQLHEPKAHTHSWDTISPISVTSNGVKFNIIAWADRASYQSEGTVVLFDTGIQNELRMYINSAWTNIVP